MADIKPQLRTRLDDGPPNAIVPGMTLKEVIDRLWTGHATKADQKLAARMLMPS